jgi:hypothetical protein
MCAQGPGRTVPAPCPPQLPPSPSSPNPSPALPPAWGRASSPSPAAAGPSPASPMPRTSSSPPPTPPSGRTASRSRSATAGCRRSSWGDPGLDVALLRVTDAACRAGPVVAPTTAASARWCWRSRAPAARVRARLGVLSAVESGFLTPGGDGGRRHWRPTSRRSPAWPVRRWRTSRAGSWGCTSRVASASGGCCSRRRRWRGWPPSCWRTGGCAAATSGSVRSPSGSRGGAGQRRAGRGVAGGLGRARRALRRGGPGAG